MQRKFSLSKDSPLNNTKEESEDVLKEALEKLNDLDNFEINSEVTQFLNSLNETKQEVGRIIDTSKFSEADFERDLEPLFFANSPKYIKYADQPLARNPEIKKIPTTEFAKQRNITWDDSVLIGRKVRQHILSHKDMHLFRYVFSNIEERMHNPLDLVLCKVDERLGDGVFLDKKAKPLPAGTVIGAYAGQIRKSWSVKNSTYLTLFNHTEEVWKEYECPDVGCDAIQFRNFCGYIADSVSEQRIKKAVERKELTPEQAAVIAPANVARAELTHYGVPIVIYVTITVIEPGEELRTQYVEDDDSVNIYWRQRGHRYVSNKDSEIIGHFEGDKIVLDSPAAVAGMEKAKRINKEEEQITKLINDAKGVEDGYDYKKTFVENIKLVLNIYSRRFAEETEEANFIKTMQTNILKSANAIQIYGVIQPTLKSELLKKVELIPLKAELTFHMTKFAKRAQQEKEATVVSKNSMPISKP